jgi:hypothetical protein
MRNLILPFILLLTFVFSCRENDMDEGLEKKTTSYDLYVVGRENNQACYWKNTIKTILPGGTNYAASTIFFDNNNLYILGFDRTALSNGINYSFWKNNVKFDVATYLGISANTPTIQNFTMSNFFVKNGDLYIAGLMKNPAPTSSQNLYQYCHWKNGVKTIVFEQNSYETSASMHLIGNDIYVPLENNITVSNTAPTTWDLGYYKNNAYHFVSTLSSFLNIHEDNGSVKLLVMDHTNQTVYYKDLLTGSTSPSPAFISYSDYSYSLQNDGNDKYFVGYEKYYKNNIQHSMYSAGSNFKYLNSFKVLDNNIYKILHTDDITGVNYNVYINDVIVQSATNSSNNINTEFFNLTVVPQ